MDDRIPSTYSHGWPDFGPGKHIGFASIVGMSRLYVIDEEVPRNPAASCAVRATPRFSATLPYPTRGSTIEQTLLFGSRPICRIAAIANSGRQPQKDSEFLRLVV